MQNDETQALAQVAERLRGRFQDVPAETVDEVVAKFHKEFDGHPIRDFIPVLVEREASDHIATLPPNTASPGTRDGLNAGPVHQMFI